MNRRTLFTAAIAWFCSLFIRRQSTPDESWPVSYRIVSVTPDKSWSQPVLFLCDEAVISEQMRDYLSGKLPYLTLDKGISCKSI